MVKSNPICSLYRFVLIISFCIISLPAFSQSFFNGSYIPNKGQFHPEVYGMFVLEHGSEVYLTAKGIVGAENTVIKSLSIEPEDIILKDSLNYELNYFSPNYPNGICGVRAYSALSIKNIDKDVDLELNYKTGKGWIQRHKGEESYIQADNALPAYPEEKDWASYWSGGLLYLDSLAAKDSYRNDKNLERNYFSLSASCTDSNGNFYIAGKGKITKFDIIPVKDSSFIVKADTLKTHPDAFFAKFRADGSLAWATYYGSSAHDEASLVGINKNNDLYIVGSLSKYPTPLMNEINSNTVFNYPASETDFPVYSKQGASNNSKGSMFILKFDTSGNRLWASMYSLNQTNKDSNRVLTQPLYMSFNSLDEVYIAGDYASETYYYKSGPFVSERGKTFPVFGPAGAFLWPADSLRAIDGSKYQDRVHDKSTDQFLIKLSTKDSVVWSTYLPFKFRLKGLAHDSKDYLYFYGRTSAVSYPSLIQREGAYFATKTTGASNVSMISYPVLGRFDVQGRMDWCTQIGGDELIDDYSVAASMAITKYDHIVLTGTTSSKDYPAVYKEGAYFTPLGDTSVVAEENMFVTEFNAEGEMLWSTLIPKKTNTSGLELCSDYSGGVFLIGVFSAENPDNQYSIFQEKTRPILYHFNRYGRLDMEKDLSLQLAPLCWYNPYTYNSAFMRDRLRISQIEDWNLGRVYTLPSLNLSVSLDGKLFLSGNTMEVESEFFSAPEAGSYMQTEVLEKDYTPLSGFIYRSKLCNPDISYPPLSMGVKDTMVCEDASFSITVNLNTQNYPQHELIFNKGTENESIGDSYTITEIGKYFVEARNVFLNCVSVVGDTVEISIVPEGKLSFAGDTLEVCISDSLGYISAGSNAISYLWHDGSTDSIYSFLYTGNEVEMIWCEQTTVCDKVNRDTAYIRFLPPYAYLGIDTVLCHSDTLLLDAYELNKDLPVSMQYTWMFNGVKVNGIGEDGGQYLVTPYDSGSVQVWVEWPNSHCKVAKDTIEVSYYKHSDVNISVSDVYVCLDEEGIFQIKDSLQASPDEYYSWYNSDNEYLSDKIEFEVRDTGVYMAVAQNYCSADTAIAVFAYYPAEWTALSFPVDTLMCENDVLYLDAKIDIHPTSYIWEDSTTTSYRTFTTPGTYVITLTDSVGCERTYEIHIESESCEPVLEFANVFTPNGDGINDLYVLKVYEKVYDFEMRIFNRWGIQVHSFKGLPEEMQWDGKNNSSGELPTGVYFYVATYKDYKNKLKKESGSITILR